MRHMYKTSVLVLLNVFYVLGKLELDIFIRPLVGNKLQEGISAELCCTSEGKPQADTLMWLKGTQIIRNVNDTRDCYKFVPLYRYHAGEYICTVNNTIDSVSITKIVYVLYPPNVNVQMHQLMNAVQINCNATGLPSKNQFEEWEHRSEFNEHIRYVQGTHGNQLIVEGNNYSNCGIYICYVTNGIPAINGNLFMTGRIKVPYRGLPIVVPPNDKMYFGKYGHEMNVKLKILSPYEITGKLIKSNWKQTFEAIETSFKSKFKGYLTVFGVNITIICTLLSFTLLLSGIEDFTNYTILVCNEYGCNNFEISVVLASSSAEKQNILRMVFVWLSVVAAVLVAVISFVKCVSLKFRIRGTEPQANHMSESIPSPYAEAEVVENCPYQSAYVLEASAIQNQLPEGYVIATASPPSSLFPENKEETQRVRSPDTQLSRIENSSLNYAELVFETAGSSTETHSRSFIHGAENRTLYTEIDLLRRASVYASTSGSDDDDFIYVDGIENFRQTNIKDET